MTDEVPPTPLPPAAQSPYPDHPAPHSHHDTPTPVHVPEGPAIGALGVALIGGALAAAVGLLISIPLWRRKQKPAAAPAPKPRAAAKPAPATRRPRRKRID